MLTRARLQQGTARWQCSRTDEVMRLHDQSGAHLGPQGRTMAATLEAESTLTDRYQTKVPETVRPEYRQGGTLGDDRKHWFRAKFLQQYRLFFRYRAS